MKIGFIGGGMMGEALMKGIIAQGKAAAADIYVSEKSAQRVEYLKNELKVNAEMGPDSFIGYMDMVFLAIKPQVAAAAMAETVKGMKKDTLVVSIVAGLTLASLESCFTEQPVVRVMPNTPLSVGVGMSCYARGSKATVEDGEKVGDLLSACGRAAEVAESALDAVTGLSGSGPAYAFLVIDALADGGVAAGLPRAMAIELAAQTLLGSAKMVLETGKHPDVLRDAVTSPAGTTIAGVRALESAGVRSAFIEAVIAATERSKELGRG